MDTVLSRPRGLPALSIRWNIGPPVIPAASSHARTPGHRRPSDVLDRAFGLKIGDLERGGLGDPEQAVRHDGEKGGVPEPPDGSSTASGHRRQQRLPASPASWSTLSSSTRQGAGPADTNRTLDQCKHRPVRAPLGTQGPP